MLSTASNLVKSDGLLQLDQVQALENVCGRLTQELKSLSDMTTERVLLTCLTAPTLEAKAGEIRQQLVEVKLRSGNVLQILAEKATAFLAELQILGNLFAHLGHGCASDRGQMS